MVNYVLILTKTLHTNLAEQITISKDLVYNQIFALPSHKSVFWIFRFKLRCLQIFSIKAFARYTRNCKKNSVFFHTLKLFSQLQHFFQQFYIWATIFTATFLEKSLQFCVQCITAFKHQISGGKMTIINAVFRSTVLKIPQIWQIFRKSTYGAPTPCVVKQIKAPFTNIKCMVLTEVG